MNDHKLLFQNILRPVTHNWIPRLGQGKEECFSTRLGNLCHFHSVVAHCRTKHSALIKGGLQSPQWRSKPIVPLTYSLNAGAEVEAMGHTLELGSAGIVLA